MIGAETIEFVQFPILQRVVSPFVSVSVPADLLGGRCEEYIGAVLVSGNIRINAEHSERKTLKVAVCCLYYPFSCPGLSGQGSVFSLCLKCQSDARSRFILLVAGKHK